jgi:peptidoglycan hydrolase-like protein with peptidoglycan-binding domain
MGQEYSLSITESLTSPWTEGSNAIQSFSEQFGISMSATVEELMELELQFKETMLEIERAGIDATNVVRDNAQGYEASEYQKSSGNGGSGGGGNSGGSSGSGAAGLVSSLSGYIRYGDKGSNVKKLQQALNELGYGNSGTSGLDGIFGDKTLAAVKKFQKDMGISADGIVGPNTKKKFKAKGYAKGSMGVDADQWALIDELGEELQVVPGKNGRLEYIKKGTGIVPADLTKRLVDLAINPQNMLYQNRPQVNVHPEIHNTQIQIDASVAELIHIDHCDQSTLPDVEKIVNKALDKHMQNLNQSIRKYRR